MKLGVFVLKVAISVPHLNFYERNAITSVVFGMWHSAKARAQIVRLFLVFTCIWQKDVAKIR